MRLTHYQRVFLTQLLANLGREPTLAGYARKFIPLALIIGLPCAAVSVLAHYILGNTGFEWLFAGIALGAISAYFGQIRVAVMVWPVLGKLLRANEIKALLVQDDERKSNGESLPQSPFRSRRVALIGLAGGLVLVGGFIGYAEGMKVWFDPTRNTPGKQVKVLTASYCGPCKLLKAHLRVNAIPFEEMDVEKSVAGDWAWQATRSRGVPVTVIDNRIYRGANLARIDAALITAGHALSLPVTAGNNSREEGPVSALKH